MLAHNDKLVGASLDAAAYVYAPNDEMRSILDKLDGDKDLVSPSIKTNGVDELRTTLMLSQVNIVDSIEAVKEACDEQYVGEGAMSGCFVGVKKAEGKKCDRCWFYDDQVGNHDLTYDGLCKRCNGAIEVWETEKDQKFELVVPEEQPVA